jgi:LysR family transcriptional regulator, glycine cleavage system transcriptional activator
MANVYRSMERPLPPLQLLIAFEAAGRLGSFKAAAAELHLTPSAISQQLRALEEHLSLSLFDRLPRAVELSEAGRFYFEVAREVLGLFRQGTVRLHERYGRRTLRVSTDPSVAYEVLIPALGDFQVRYPDIDLRIEASSALVDPRRDLIDAAVRFGRGQPWPGLASDELAAMTSTLVASPALLKKRPIRQPSDLAQHTLLDIAGAPDHWGVIAAQAGFRIGRRQSFDSYLATLQAAAHGIGLAVGLFPLSSAWVHDGRLAVPLPLRVPGVGYYLVCRPEDRERADLASLRTWLTGRFAELVPLDAAPPTPLARKRRLAKSRAE